MASTTSGGVRIEYRVEGEGPALLLHHGFGGSSGGWYDYGYVEALAPKYRLLIPDARGHGASDKPHAASDYALRNQVSDVLAVLDAAGVEQTRYYGYSMGALVGYGVCKYAPDRLAGLAVGGFSPAGLARERPQQILDVLRRGPSAWIAVLEADGSLHDEYKERVRAADFEAYIALWEHWDGEADPVEDAFLAARFPRLVIMGTEDRAFESAMAVCQGDAGISTVVLEGLNHSTALRCSDLVLPQLTTFFASVVDGPGRAAP